MLDTEPGTALARHVRLEANYLVVDLADGRSLTVPTDWFPRLRHASDEELAGWQLIGGGLGIHWPDLDEDISVQGLLEGRRSQERPESLEQWLNIRRR